MAAASHVRGRCQGYDDCPLGLVTVRSKMVWSILNTGSPLISSLPISRCKAPWATLACPPNIKGWRTERRWGGVETIPRKVNSSACQLFRQSMLPAALVSLLWPSCGGPRLADRPDHDWHPSSYHRSPVGGRCRRTGVGACVALLWPCSASAVTRPPPDIPLWQSRP